MCIESLRMMCTEFGQNAEYTDTEKESMKK